MSSMSKDKQLKLQEKYQAILSALLREEDNKYCGDCDAKGPRWASWNLGIFLCIRCAGIHRNLGVHISRVKSVNLDQWTAQQIASMQSMGNSKARAVYECNLGESFRRSQNDSAMEQFIRAKYEQKKWIAKDWQPGNIVISPDLIDDDFGKDKAKTGTSVASVSSNSSISKSASGRSSAAGGENKIRNVAVPPSSSSVKLSSPTASKSSSSSSAGDSRHRKEDRVIAAAKVDPVLLEFDFNDSPTAAKATPTPTPTHSSGAVNAPSADLFANLSDVFVNAGPSTSSVNNDLVDAMAPMADATAASQNNSNKLNKQFIMGLYNNSNISSSTSNIANSNSNDLSSVFANMSSTGSVGASANHFGNFLPQGFGTGAHAGPYATNSFMQQNVQPKPSQQQQQQQASFNQMSNIQTQMDQLKMFCGTPTHPAAAAAPATTTPAFAGAGYPTSQLMGAQSINFANHVLAPQKQTTAAASAAAASSAFIFGGGAPVATNKAETNLFPNIGNTLATDLWQ